jgi:serine/threonine protein kinase
MLPALKRHYRAIVKVAHPDVYQTRQDQMLAQTAFHLLTDWFNEAKRKIELGEYGKRNAAPNMVLQNRKREYSIGNNCAQGEIFNFYPCSFTEYGRTYQAVLKVVRDPHDNDLVESEGRALEIFARGADAEKFSPYFPNLIDSFVYEDSGVHRRAVILQRYDGWYSLEDVHKVHPDGIDPKDMAWMWRRLLVVLGFSHARKVLHSAVLPSNIWILPEQHGLMLVDWSYAVFDPLVTGDYIKAVASKYMDWYPQEVLRRDIPMFGTDLQMSAKCMMWLLGGDPQKRSVPKSVPDPIHTFLKGCTLPGRRAPQNAWRLLEEFDELIGKLWGERKFHPFYMK